MMERTVSESVAHGATPHMGLLRCQMDRRGRRVIKGYKKRFWVVNERHCRLEVYRNDQEHVPLRVFRASDIRNVVYADDKQNRFFVMLVQNRGSRDIKFRMDSFEEREEWSNAITRIMDTYTTSNKHKNVLGMVQRRAKTVSDNLKVKIMIDSVRLLAEVPDQLLQYVAEAVDLALASISAIVTAYGGNTADMPRIFILAVHAVREEELLGGLPGPTYNPVGRSMTINVCLVRTKAARVNFAITQPEEVFKLLQSTVFRNPLIEGWIETEPNCARACADIQEYLGVNPPRSEWITFQWGQHVTDSTKVKAFLQKFVNATFIERILHSVKDGVARVERLIAETNTAMANRGTTGGGAGGLSFAVTQFESGTGGSPRMPRRSANITNFGSADFSGAVAGGALGTQIGNFVHSRQASTTVQTNTASDQALAVKLIRESIQGLCIQLEKRVVEQGRSPPTVLTQHAPGYEQHCRPAFLLVTKCHRAFVSQHVPTGDSLSDELYAIAFNAFLQMQLSLLRNDLNGCFHRRVKVVLMWDQLFHAAASIQSPLTVSDLPQVVRHVRALCLSRLQHAAQILRHPQSHAAGSTMPPEEGHLYSTFCHCVNAVMVEFVPYASHGPHSNATVTEPSIKNGVLADTLYCVKEEEATLFLTEMAGHYRGGAGTMRWATSGLTAPNLHGVQLYAAEAKLGKWCENYFSDPSHIVAAAPYHQLEDEFDSDSDDNSIGTLQGVDFGESVALERSAETQLLTMQRVVNAVYDSQRGVPIDLKIGTDDILEAIQAFATAFGEHKRPSKHDVARVLTLNLQRLRQMYVRAVDDETTSLLTWEQARQLLRDFCEYAVNDTYADEELRKLSMSETQHNSSHFSSREDAPRSAAEQDRITAGRATREPVSPLPLHVDVYPDSAPRVLSGSSSPLSLGPLPRPSSASGRSGSSIGDETRAARSSTMPGLSTVSRRRHSFAATRYRSVLEVASPAASVVSVVSVGSPERGLPPLQIPHAGLTDTGEMYDFVSVSEVALTKLLPREARLAQMAWRVGLVFGLENTGKSLIINSMQGVVQPTAATVGMLQHVVAFEEWVWALNELGGRESFRKNWRYYARRIAEVHFLFFVVDVRSTQSMREARSYLKEVTNHFSHVPIVVIFNNFREGHRRFNIEEYEMPLKLHKLRKRHQSEVLSCVCDITMVHSKNRRLPSALEGTLRRLSKLLLADAAENEKTSKAAPRRPKMTAVLGNASAAGAGLGVGGSGGLGGNVSFSQTNMPHQTTSATHSGDSSSSSDSAMAPNSATVRGDAEGGEKAK